MLGGIVFLVPVVIVVIILGKAFQFMLQIALLIDRMIPIESIAGIAVANLLAIAALLLVCFFAGMVAKSAPAKKLYKTVDNTLLAIPGYVFFKGYTDSMKMGEDAASSLQPVLVRYDDCSQLGFEVERLDNGKVVIYVPGAPNPWSGTVVYFDADRVRKLNLSVSQAVSNVRQLGRGSKQLEQETQF